MTDHQLVEPSNTAPLVQQPEIGEMSPLVSAMLAKGEPTIEVLGQLMALNERWEANNARKQYHLAMANARTGMGSAKRSARNNHLNTSYASLDDLIEAARPSLSAHGLSFSWDIKQEGHEVTATCKITHAGGHTESTAVTMPVGAPITSNQGKQVTSGAQTVGIAITYAKRYSFSAMVGIATEDDDGNASALTTSAAPAIEMLTDTDLDEIKAVCDELGKSYDKWYSYQAKSRSVVDGVLQIARSRKGAAIKNIRDQAVKNAKKAEDKA